MAHVTHAPPASSASRKYARRTPERGAVYQILLKHWSTFAAQTQSPIPKLVSDEVHAFLRCGVLAHGFVRALCEKCGHEELVAFSCKRRGICGSCIARRMNEVSAHLVDFVLPEVSIRQWVASFSWRLRYLMGYDRKLASEVLSAFMQSVRDRIAWRVKRERFGLKSVEDVETGAVLFVQRFDSALRLNVHGHALALDGGYVHVNGKLEFHSLAEVTLEDVQWVAARTNKRIETILLKHGRALDDLWDVDPVGDQEPFLAECYAGAIAGRGTLRLVQGDEHDADSSKKLVAQATHVNVHAERVVDGRDRPQLEPRARRARFASLTLRAHSARCMQVHAPSTLCAISYSPFARRSRSVRHEE